ncbi:MAG: hypothetical protein R3292_13790 [Alcanivorax sp.]|nr:hypothetical protein [Alcanivorax sp.]
MRFVIRPAHPDDNEAILSLLEGTPQEGAVTLNFERRPDYFRGACVTCEEPDVWVAEPREPDSRTPIGAVYNVGRRRLWVNGEVRNIRYAHDLRIAVSCRNGTLLHRMFRKLRSQLAAGEWLQTTVLRDNQASMSTVASGRAGLPTYYPFGTIETSLIYTRARRCRLPEGWSIRPTTPEDRPTVARFLREEGSKKQFFPCWHLDSQQSDRFCFGMSRDPFLGLWEGGELRGLLGFWDQTDIKQTRVLAYRRGLRVLRHLYNSHSKLRGGLRLPPPGGVLSYLTLHSIVVADNAPRRLQALLDHAVDSFNGRYDALVCGFFSNDPLCRVAARYRRQLLLSDHFLISYEGDPREQLDSDRLPYVDVARL